MNGMLWPTSIGHRGTQPRISFANFAPKVNLIFTISLILGGMNNIFNNLIKLFFIF